MSKFNIDYSNLEKSIYKKSFKLNEVKHLLETIAFDIVRFKDGDNDSNLWQVQSADDGEYIVALYKPEEKADQGNWEVMVNKTAGSLQISYKGDPIVRLASSKLGIPQSEVHKVPQYLPAKLAENKKLVKSLLNELTESAKKEVLSKYPELL